MTDAEAAAQRAQQDRDSAARAKHAAQPLRPSSRGSVESAPSQLGAPRPAVSEPLAPSGPVRFDDTAPVPVRRSYGINEGDQSSLGSASTSRLAYLGHLANDDVTAEGHNIGMKSKGAVTTATIAKCGYRTLPGSCMNELGASITTPKIERAAMTTIKSPSPSAQPFRSSKADRVNYTSAPPTAKHADVAKPPKGVKADVAMSARHHRESVTFNAAHAKEHTREVTKHQRALAKLRRA